MKAPTFIESVVMADALAERFAALFPSKEPNESHRKFLRQYVIPGLRWLWRTGSASGRTSIAARIAVWRGLDTDKVSSICKRIQQREQERARNTPDVVAALEDLLEQADLGAVDEETQPIVERARAALAYAKGGK